MLLYQSDENKMKILKLQDVFGVYLVIQSNFIKNFKGRKRKNMTLLKAISPCDVHPERKLVLNEPIFTPIAS